MHERNASDPEPSGGIRGLFRSFGRSRASADAAVSALEAELEACQQALASEQAAREDDRRELVRLETALKTEAAKSVRAEQRLRELETRAGAEALTVRGVLEAFLRSLDGQVQSRLVEGDILRLELSTRIHGLTDIGPVLKRWTIDAGADGEPEGEALSAGAPEPGEASKAERILVAEDDPVSRQILKTIFAREPSWDVRFAANGVQAWEALAAGFDPQVCVFDHLMPGMDGLTVVERMRRDLRFMHTGVIMCTASRNRSDITKAGALRIAHYLVKPYKAADVLETVRATLRQTRTMRSEAEKQLGISSSEFTSMVEALHHEAVRASEEAREHFLAGRSRRATHALQRVQSAALSLRLDELAASLGRLSRAYEGKSFDAAASEWDQLQKSLEELGVS